MDPQLDIKWNEFKAYCVNKIHVDNAVKTYLDTCTPVSLEQELLTLQVPTMFGLQAISDRYLQQMKILFCETGFGKDICLKIPSSKKEEHIFPSSPRFEQPHVRSAENGLNHNYTFDSFIVGNSNRLSHAACLAVADNPGIAYNPLFIWGNVGLGKTHLMQAIGHSVLEKDPLKKVLYVTSENFTNDVIKAIKTGSQQKLHERYRQLDLLLIDDIQFISGKEATEEEFFNTFNSMHNAGKQIVICSDRPPQETGLEDRLVSRFSSGLVTDIQSPDFETRFSILQYKSDNLSLDIPNDVIDYIAKNVQNNIRSLEGALNRVRSYSELNEEPITVEKTTLWIKDLIQNGSNGPITIDKIQQLTAQYFGFTLEELLSKKRTAELALARQVAMYLVRNNTAESLQQIGISFNKKDHTTVLYACKKVESLLKSDTDTRVKMVVDNVVKKL